MVDIPSRLKITDCGLPLGWSLLLQAFTRRAKQETSVGKTSKRYMQVTTNESDK